LRYDRVVGGLRSEAPRRRPVRRALTVLVVVPTIVLACGGDDEEYEGPYRPLTTEVQEGIATFYDADGSGNCSFDKSPGDLDVVALGWPEYDRGASCGACLRVTGPDGEVTVRVVDSCPPCHGHDVNLDLSESAFAKIANPKRGRVPISYRLVECEVSGNLAYHFKSGSSKYWTAIQVRNHKLPIAKLEYRRGSSWVAMPRASYNYFIAEKGVGDQPDGLRLRVTAVDGQRVEETLPGNIPSNRIVPGAKQFE
jgi:expansin (peptidoglycan-binding protein)